MSLQIADSVLFPWLRDYLLLQLDPYSTLQCTVLITLVTELSEFCTSSVDKVVHNTVKTHIEQLHRGLIFVLTSFYPFFNYTISYEGFWHKVKSFVEINCNSM